MPNLSNAREKSPPSMQGSYPGGRRQTNCLEHHKVTQSSNGQEPPKKKQEKQLFNKPIKTCQEQHIKTQSDYSLEHQITTTNISTHKFNEKNIYQHPKILLNKGSYIIHKEKRIESQVIHPNTCPIKHMMEEDNMDVDHSNQQNPGTTGANTNPGPSTNKPSATTEEVPLDNSQEEIDIATARKALLAQIHEQPARKGPQASQSTNTVIKTQSVNVEEEVVFIMDIESFLLMIGLKYKDYEEQETKTKKAFIQAQLNEEFKKKIFASVSGIFYRERIQGYFMMVEAPPSIAKILLENAKMSFLIPDSTFSDTPGHRVIAYQGIFTNERDKEDMKPMIFHQCNINTDTHENNQTIWRISLTNTRIIIEFISKEERDKNFMFTMEIANKLYFPQKISQGNNNLWAYIIFDQLFDAFTFQKWFNTNKDFLILLNNAILIKHPNAPNRTSKIYCGIQVAWKTEESQTRGYGVQIQIANQKGKWYLNKPCLKCKEGCSCMQALHLVKAQKRKLQF